MPGRPRHVVLFPRYTALADGGPFFTVPVDVRAYAKAIVTAWQSRSLGASPSQATFTVQHSANLDTWESFAGQLLEPGVDAGATEAIDLRRPWIRVKAEVDGTPGAVTVWVVATLVPRDDDGAAGGDA